MGCTIEHIMIAMELCWPKNMFPYFKLFPGFQQQRTEALKERKKSYSEKESATFTNSKPVFGKKDLRGSLGHQCSTLRGTRAHFYYRLGFLIITWWERGRLGMVGVR
jgi:hypothetical protein